MTGLGIQHHAKSLSLSSSLDNDSRRRRHRSPGYDEADDHDVSPDGKARLAQSDRPRVRIASARRFGPEPGMRDLPVAQKIWRACKRHVIPSIFIQRDAIRWRRVCVLLGVIYMLKVLLIDHEVFFNT